MKNPEENTPENLEALSRTIIDTVITAIVVIDSKGLTELFNPGAEELFGYSPEEVLGKNVNLLMPEPFRTEHDSYIKNYLKTGKKKIIGMGREVMARKHDGTEFPVRLEVTEIGHEGQWKFVGLITDLTEKRKDEAELERTRKNLAEAQRIASLGSWQWDIDNNTLYWSDEIYRIFGLRPQKFGATYEAFMNAVHPEDREYVQSSVKEALEGKPYNIEHRVVRPDGEERIVSERGEVVFGPGGQPLSMTGTVHDSTELKKAERALEEANRALDLKVKARTAELSTANMELRQALEETERASRAKTEFLANMSHELRTPLNGIIGLTQLTLATSLRQEQEDNLRMALSSAESLLMIINDILDISKVAAGKLSLKSEAFNLRELFGETVNYFVHMAAEKGVSVLFNIPPDVPHYFIGDPLRINQVLTNLLGNAVKFTSKGSITVDVTMLETLKGSARLRFRVRDTGIGIPGENISKIFNAFDQAGNSSTREYGGTGLGLSISSELVKMMGGALEVQSAPELGSTFSFNIVLGLAREPETRPEDSTPGRKTISGGARNLRILLAEDNLINQKLAVRLLTKAGHEVTLASTGRETLKALEAGDIDLVLMDVMMPDLDGFEATGAIRQAEKQSGAHMPIIAMTANAMMGDRERCIEAGMDDYVSKPIDFRALTEAIERAVAR